MLKPKNIMVGSSFRSVRRAFSHVTYVIMREHHHQCPISLHWPDVQLSKSQVENINNCFCATYNMVYRVVLLRP